MKTGSAINVPEKFVVDASVAVKWFFYEEERAKALALLMNVEQGKAVGYAPSILPYEVGNALWKGKKMDIKRMIEAMETLMRAQLVFVALEERLVKLAIQFMVQYNLTFYDASYGALAYSLGVPLMSANPKDHKKIQEIEVIELNALH